MTDTKHTPTPLISDDGYIFDADHNIVGKTYDKRYAYHIVKCVNMHEELVEALKIARDEYLRGFRFHEIPNETPYDETLKKSGAL